MSTKITLEFDARFERAADQCTVNETQIRAALFDDSVPFASLPRSLRFPVRFGLIARHVGLPALTRDAIERIAGRDHPHQVPPMVT